MKMVDFILPLPMAPGRPLAPGFRLRRSLTPGFSVVCADQEPPFSPGAAPTAARRVFVLGSSVAAGRGAKRGLGWVALVADTLQHDGTAVVNLAKPSATVASTLAALPSTLAPLLHKYAAEDGLGDVHNVVVVALSLGNEGMEKGCAAENARIAKRFTSHHGGLREIVDSIRRLGVRDVVLTTPYACSAFDDQQAALTAECGATLKRQAGPGTHIVDMYTSFHNELGGWPEHCYMDDFHPNTAGHLALSKLFLEQWPWPPPA